MFCMAQKANVSTDEYERADEGYAYDPYSDYYQTYNDEVQENEDTSKGGVYNLMVRVVDDGDKAMAAGNISKL